MSRPALVLDCRGMPCPLPVIELAKHVDDVEPGEVIAVDSDDVAAAVDIPAWCRMRDQEYAGSPAPDTYDVRRLR